MTFISLPETNTVSPFEGIHGKVIHTDHQSIAFWQIEAGTLLPEHSHVHEQIAIVTQGELELTVNGVTQVLTPGQVATIPSNVPHSAKALTYVEITDTFYPVREDLKG